MATRVLTPVQVTYTREAKPGTEYQVAARDALRVQGGTGVRGYAYFKYVVDVADVESVVSLLHTVRATETEASVALVAQRTGAGNLSNVNWDNASTKVPTTGSTVSDTDTISWTHDVTALAPTGGTVILRLSTSATQLIKLYGPRAARFGPTLTVVTETEATQPTDVQPNGVVSVAAPFFTWSGQPDVDTVQGAAAAEDEPWTAASGFTSATWTSAEEPSTAHELDTADAGWTGITAGTSADLSFRYRLPSGWSEWSEPVTISRVAKPTVAITNPLSTDADSTPPFVHTVTGTQTAWQKIVRRDGVQVADSGKRAGADLTWTPAVGAKSDGDAMEYEVRVWDDEDRAHTSGDPAYAVEVQAWTYERSALVAPMDYLSAVQDVIGSPKMLLTAGRSPLSDEVTFLVDGEEIGTVDSGGELATWLVRPNADVEIGALAVVNDEDSSVVVSTLVRSRVSGMWLVDSETDRGFVLSGTDGISIGYGGNTEVHNPVAAANLIRNVLSVRGVEGTITGWLDATESLPSPWTRDEQLENIAWLREHPETVLRLIGGDLNESVVASDLFAVFDPALSRHEQMWHQVSFAFSAA